MSCAHTRTQTLSKNQKQENFCVNLDENWKAIIEEFIGVMQEDSSVSNVTVENEKVQCEKFEAYCSFTAKYKVSVEGQSACFKVSLGLKFFEDKGTLMYSGPYVFDEQIVPCPASL